jgi:hypothetical protein
VQLPDELQGLRAFVGTIEMLFDAIAKCCAVRRSGTKGSFESCTCSFVCTSQVGALVLAFIGITIVISAFELWSMGKKD